MKPPNYFSFLELRVGTQADPQTLSYLSQNQAQIGIYSRGRILAYIFSIRDSGERHSGFRVHKCNFPLGVASIDPRLLDVVF